MANSKVPSSSSIMEKSSNGGSAYDADEDTSDDTVYCMCRQSSYGKMVMCDNPECEFVWFHFPCVGLRAKPRGNWYCPKCKPLFPKKKA